MVYFIQSGRNGPIKIGYSENNVKGRLSDLQTASPNQLFLLGAMMGDVKDEVEIQEEFEDLHIRGEWYKPDKKLKRFIFRSCEQEPESLENTHPGNGVLLDDILKGIERNYIERALAVAGCTSKAARLLGISFRSMRYRIDKYK